MANIVFRLPSKQIQYGYVEVSGTPEEFGLSDLSDPGYIGAAYSAYVGAYLEGELAGIKSFMASGGPARIGEAKEAPGKPVEGVSGVRQVEPDAEAQALIQEELGATVVEESEAPWSPAKAEAAGQAAAAKPKPWENNATPKVAKIDW